ncbi:MAG: universal stress protein [Desulfobacteraceae bacterium]|jgi:nucleotide-binding universal stress UspA family protein|nr:universal stress protein [Desulfobacteraceae bacterium]
MIPQIKRILYTTDLSDNSTEVFEYVMNSAKKYDAGIIILHVLEPFSVAANPIALTYLTEEQVKKTSEERLAYVKDLINKRLRTFCENDPECADRVESIELCEGFPPDMILMKADEFNCDVIAMGTHGKGLIRSTFLGSTSKRVLRRTRKPVLIVPLPREGADTGLDDI